MASTERSFLKRDKLLVLHAAVLAASAGAIAAAGAGPPHDANPGLGGSSSSQGSVAEAACRAPSLERFEYSQVHMGLPVRIVLHAADESTARVAAGAAFQRIAALDRMMSDYRPDSEVRRLAEHAGEGVSVSRDLFAIVARALEMARLTGGAFDPTVGPLVALWREARRTVTLPGTAALAAARSKVGWHRISLDPAASTVRLHRAGMALDLGGIAKGYILQEARSMLRLHGVTRVLLESGGDIVVGDPPPGRRGWAVQTGSADAAFAERASGLTNAALATSGPSAQFVEIAGVRYSHVIDPRTGLGVTAPRTARVIAVDAATADALATALTVLEPSSVGSVLARFPAATASFSSAETGRQCVQSGQSADSGSCRHGEILFNNGNPGDRCSCCTRGNPDSWGNLGNAGEACKYFNGTDSARPANSGRSGDFGNPGR